MDEECIGRAVERLRKRLLEKPSAKTYQQPTPFERAQALAKMLKQDTFRAWQASRFITFTG